MRYFVTILSIFLFLALSFSSCKKLAEPIDPLDEIGLLGKWLRDTTYINGVLSSVLSIDTLTFTTGAAATDLDGEYVSSSPGFSASGILYVDTVNETVRFGIVDTTLREYDVRAERLIFRYIIGTKSYRASWGRVE